MFKQVKNKDLMVFRVAFIAFFMLSLAFRLVIVGANRTVEEVSQPVIQEMDYNKSISKSQMKIQQTHEALGNICTLLATGGIALLILL